MTKQDDTEFEDHIITKVVEGDDYYDVQMAGAGFGLSKSHGVTPKVGQTLRLYATLGKPIRGVDLDGVEVFYRTQETMAEIARATREEMRQKQKEEFEEKRSELDAEYDALPPVFKRRIDKFRTNNPDFRWEYEDYELFVCTEAVKIASVAKTREEVIAFSDMPYEEQKKLADLAPKHSGNTMGMACILAAHYVTEPENVVEMHGALAPLVGSEAYGCVPKTETEETR